MLTYQNSQSGQEMTEETTLLKKCLTSNNASISKT